MTPPSLASRLRAMAEEFASMLDRPSEEVSLAAANVLRGFADEVESEVSGWDVRGYQRMPQKRITVIPDDLMARIGDDFSWEDAAREAIKRAEDVRGYQPRIAPVPPHVALHLSCLPANLRELKRGLECGMFGPPVPLGRGPEQQQWVNAVMAIGTTENAIEAVEYLQHVAEVVGRLPGEEKPEP